MKSSTRKLVLSTLMAIGLAACGSRGTGSIDEGQVQLTITTVPVDVQCIQLTATNGTSVAVRSFDVIPLQSANVTVNGLPTGTVTLTEAAYDATCDFVSPQAPPTWISRAPVVVQLQPGQLTSVNIELVRPGSVSITNTFTDNGAVDGGTDGSVRDASPDRGISAPDGGSIDQAASVRDSSAVILDVSPDRVISAPDTSPDLAAMPKDTSPDLARDISPDIATSVVVYRINAGSSSAVTPFAADQYYSGGTARTTTNTINTAGLATAAPAAVYQSERFGASTYTFPGLTPGKNYLVRLHFAELYWTASGKRVFNVAINGSTVLSNFDIYVAAGNAGNKAVVRDFTITNPTQIVVAFTNVTDNASIEGIEIFPL